MVRHSDHVVKQTLARSHEPTDNGYVRIITDDLVANLPQEQ